MAGYISADSHVTEPVELYAERVDRSFRDRVPRIAERDGWRTLVAEGMAPRKLMPASALGRAVVGSPDPGQRRREQEQDGVVGEVVFPNWALQHGLRRRGPALQVQISRAYNDWAHEAFSAEHRSLAVAMIPMADPETAVAEAQRAAGLGMRACPCPAGWRAPNTTRRPSTRSGPAPASSASP